MIHHQLTGPMIASHLNPLNVEFNPICHLLALLLAHHIFHVSGLRVKCLTLRPRPLCGRSRHVRTEFLELFL